WGYLIPRYDGTWTDVTYYDATKGRGIPNTVNLQVLPKETIGMHEYWLHNIRIAYRTPDGHLEIAGWVRNVLDTPVKTYAFDGSTFQSTTIYFVGDPRTYGVTASVTFCPITGSRSRARGAGGSASRRRAGALRGSDLPHGAGARRPRVPRPSGRAPRPDRRGGRTAAR